MWGKVLGVATGVGLRYFESPDFYNRLNRVQTSAMLRPHQVTQGLLTMGSALAACPGWASPCSSSLPSCCPWSSSRVSRS